MDKQVFKEIFKMSCRICGRDACTECFHSIAEQEKYEEKDGKLILKPEHQEQEKSKEKGSTMWEHLH